VLHLVDLDQRVLVPLLDGEGDEVHEPVPVDGTRAGDSYRRVEVVVDVDPDGRSVWVPVVDGTERLGVVEYRYRGGDARPDVEPLRVLSSLTAELVMSKRAYGDAFEIARRRSPLTVAAELLWQLLPPLTFATDEIVITGFFVPTEDIGGDAFDYGVDRRHAGLAIFDAMGHGLGAGLMATTAVAAYRNGRRELLDLQTTTQHIGAAIGTQFGSRGFVTGIVASLDHATGVLTWCSAGHPPPLILREGRRAELQPIGGQPFGVGPASDVMQAKLEPGDRMLLYSDGISEARGSGTHLGPDRLVELVTRIADEENGPEAVRKVMHAVEEFNDGPMRDDATLLMVEWKGASGRELTV
jgi:serine phosphatase RsbU (regulator of sigma subunit)